MQKRLVLISFFVCAFFLVPVFTHSALASEPVITTTSLPHEIVGTYYNPTLEVTDGVSPFTWTISSGSLPSGISLGSSDGVLSGTPTSPGTYNFIAQVTDDNSDSDTQALTLIVRPLLVITTTSLPEGTLNRPYSQYVEISGGAGPFTWSTNSGSLPRAGLDLNTSTGEISGTPTGTFSVGDIFLVSDSDGQSVGRPLTLTVNPPPVISANSLPNANVNTPYFQILDRTGGGTLPLSRSIASGSLPSGLSLNDDDNGHDVFIQGRPIATGNFNFVVRVEDANGASVSKPFALTVDYTPPVIGVLANATVNRPYSKAIGLNGGLAPFAWNILSGSLPSGFSLNSSTGVISGSPTTISSSSFVVQVEDADSVIATKSLTLAVKSAPAITTTSLPDGASNTPYSQNISFTGGATPLAWDITSGSLPDGLSIDPATGEIHGSTSGVASTSFTIQLTDTNGATTTRELSLMINYASIAITTTTLPPAVVGSDYSQTLNTTGGTLPSNWTITSGSMPYGLSLDSPTGQISGYVYGAPYNGPGTYHLAFRVDDSNSEFDTQDITLIVYGPPTITTTSLVDTTEETIYSQTLTATGGLAPYTWSTTGGNLPDGLSLNSSTGTISGTPTADTAETYNFTVQASDANSQTDTQELTLVVNPPPTITTIALDAATVGATYSKTLTKAGGTSPFTWSIASGSLPAGLSLGSSTGTISGTPTTAGVSTFIVQALDVNMATTSQELTLIVNSAPVIARNSLPHGKVGKNYSQFIPVAGGTSPYTWTVSAGSLPSGLSLDSDTGIISGTPDQIDTETFTIEVQDSNSSTTSKTFTLVVS